MFIILTFCGTLKPSRKYSNLYHLYLTDRCVAEAEHCTMLSRSFVCGRRSICVGKTCYTDEVSPGNQSQASACGHSRALDKSSPLAPLEAPQRTRKASGVTMRSRWLARPSREWWRHGWRRSDHRHPFSSSRCARPPTPVRLRARVGEQISS